MTFSSRREIYKYFPSAERRIAEPFAFLFLLGENLDSSVMLVAGGGMTAAFLVKACEFFVNKFCFIDAQIVVVYKEVLDKILKGE